MSRPTADSQPTGRADPAAITCRDLVTLVTDYLEEALPAHDRARFDAHLDACEGCRRHLEHMRVTIRALGRLGEDDFVPTVRERFLTAFRDWKR